MNGCSGCRSQWEVGDRGWGWDGAVRQADPSARLREADVPEHKQLFLVALPLEVALALRPAIPEARPQRRFGVCCERRLVHEQSGQTQEESFSAQCETDLFCSICSVLYCRWRMASGQRSRKRKECGLNSDLLYYRETKEKVLYLLAHLHVQ